MPQNCVKKYFANRCLLTNFLWEKKMPDRKLIVQTALEKLATDFSSLDLTFHQIPNSFPGDVTSYWPGAKNEDVLVCVFKGNQIHEPFHRQDFFFINYAYKNSYQALSEKFDNLITIGEDDCYIGQPYSGYALRAHGTTEAVIIGILIRKNSFFREYLPTVYTDSKLFKFFLAPETKKFSDEFIHLDFSDDYIVREILEMMVIEYANKKEDSQQLLKSILQTLLLEIARKYKIQTSENSSTSLAEQILVYVENHSDAVTLQNVAKHFGYHPNYISSLLHKKTGRMFSKILLEKRMERAVLLIKNTDLPIENISEMLGYSNHSNFYKAFKEYFGKTPREYNSTKRIH